MSESEGGSAASAPGFESLVSLLDSIGLSSLKEHVHVMGLLGAINPNSEDIIVGILMGSAFHLMFRQYLQPKATELSGPMVAYQWIKAWTLIEKWQNRRHVQGQTTSRRRFQSVAEGYSGATVTKTDANSTACGPYSKSLGDVEHADDEVDISTVMQKGDREHRPTNDWRYVRYNLNCPLQFKL